MKPASRVYFAACAALIGFAFGYALPSYARLPRAFYDPLAHSWHWAQNLGPIPMGYVGLIVWGALVATLCAALAVAVTGAWKREPSDRAFGLWGAWALTALAVVCGYYTWNNWP